MTIITSWIFFCPLPSGIMVVIFLFITMRACLEDVNNMRVSRTPLVFLMVILVFIPADTTPWNFQEIEHCACCVLALIAFGSARILSSKKLGLADVWMAGCIGAYGGMEIMGSATLSAIVLMLPACKKSTCPFIPALLEGTVFAVFYLRFFRT